MIIKTLNNKRLSFVLMFLIQGILSCNKNPRTTYVISKEDSLYRRSFKKKDGIVLIPPGIPQGPYTFIIDSLGNIYYYSVPLKRGARIVDDESIEKVKFINLGSNEIFKIPKGTEKIFFEENVLLAKSKAFMKHVYVASFKDSIIGSFIPYLKQMEKESSSHLSVTVRLALDEERKVMKYKADGKYYPDSATLQ